VNKISEPAGNWSGEIKRILGFLKKRAFPLGVASTTLGITYLVLAYRVLNFWVYVPHYELSWTEQLSKYLLFKAYSQWEYPLLALSVLCVAIGIMLLMLRVMRRDKTSIDM
jgi:hypothetical protein